MSQADVRVVTPTTNGLHVSGNLKDRRTELLADLSGMARVHGKGVFGCHGTLHIVAPQSLGGPISPL